MGIELTPRCKVLRTIANELARIQSHLLCVGAAGLDLGAFTAFLYGFNEREVIYDIVEYMSGQRFHTSWCRVGGAQHGPARRGHVQGDGEEVRERADAAGRGGRRQAAEQEPHLRRPHEGRESDNPRGGDRLEPQRPARRAAGVRRDIRKDEPYLCYADNWDGQGAPAVDFKVPVMSSGDVYARYLVRLEEIQQSLHIIRQLIDRIPPGPVNVSPEGKEVLPPKDQVYSSIEGLIQHFELIMTNRGFAAPRGEVYGCIESANGELGYYIVSDGGNVPWRVRTRPCSFINYSIFPKLIEGHMISDVVAVLGSINVIAAELDR
jgi:NADH-quinone oxidoreductase subunit D